MNTTRRMHRIIVLFATVALAVLTPVIAVCAADGGPSSQSAPAAGPCVALLEAEYITPDAAASRSELTGWLDTVLTDSLTRQKNLTVLDRHLLDKVLAEKKLERLDAATADAALRPFIASGVLICPTIVVDPATGKAVVTVQAVLAQRGDLLAEIAVAAELASDGWKTTPAMEESLAQFWRDLRRGIEARLGLPSLEVRHMALDSKLDRLQWLADDLTDALAAQPREGLVLLVPRQTVHTKEERLLRLMGLARPADGDKSAGFAAASDYQLSGELVEEVKPGVPFEQTPMKLVLQLAHNGKQLANKDLIGTVGQYAKLRGHALSWVADELRQAAKIKAIPPDESHAKALAQQELTTVQRLAAISYGASAMEMDRRQRLALAALRAAHLDPTSESAAYLAAVSIDGVYEARGQERTLASKDRVIQLGQQYLDRFGDKVATHHCEVLKRIGSAGYSATWIIRGRPGGTEAVTGQPDVRQYPYASAYVRAWMEVGIRAETDNEHYGGSNSLQAAPIHLRLHLIPNIPDDGLDEEYVFWKREWERVDALTTTNIVPWECIDLAFQARRRDAQSVRRLLQKLADKYPPTNTSIWRLTTDDVCRLYLHTAGDSEWQTWRPTHSQTTPKRPGYNDFLAFYRHFEVPFLSLWDYENGPAFDGTLVHFPEHVQQLGQRNYVVPYPRVQFLLVAGEDAWFVAPCLWDRLNNRPHNLLSVPLKSITAGDKPVALDEADVTSVDWPKTAGPNQVQPIVTCHAVTGHPAARTVWLGTRNCGLARFDKKQGRWVGRWYGPEKGLPLEITRLRASDGGSTLRVEGLGPERVTHRPDGGKDIRRERVLAELAVEDGQVTMLEQPADRFGMVEATSEGPRRLWQIEEMSIHELDAKTLKPLPVPLGTGGDQASHGKGFLWANMKDFQPTDNPIDKINTAFGLRDALWLLISPADNVVSRGDGLCIMIYRPAPHGDTEWAKNDLWIGPFKSPDGGTIFGIAPDGEGNVWVTCAGGVYRVDSRRLLLGAIKAGNCATTAGWRDAYQKRLETAPWRYRARDFFANSKHDQALTLIEKELAALPEDLHRDTDSKVAVEWTDLMLYRAMALAFQKRSDEALVLLDKLRSKESIEAAARYKAACMRVEILMSQEQWQSALDGIVQLEGSLDEPWPHSHWSETISRARRELAKASDHPSSSTRPGPP